MRRAVIHISLLFGAGLLLASPVSPQRADSLMQKGYQFVWQGEFDQDGKPDPKNWIYEQGGPQQGTSVVSVAECRGVRRRASEKIVKTPPLLISKNQSKWI